MQTKVVQYKSRRKMEKGLNKLCGRGWTIVSQSGQFAGNLRVLVRTGVTVTLQKA
jgi:hypothetical protein